MRKFFWIILITLCSPAMAESIPPELVKHLKPFKIEEVNLKGNVLRIRVSSSVVNQDTFRAIASASCAPLWMNGKKDGWDKAQIDRVEVINQIGAQGFAFIGGRKSCADLANVTGDNEHTFIASRTWVCVAGNPCRPRRDGEKISGDD